MRSRTRQRKVRLISARPTVHVEHDVRVQVQMRVKRNNL